MSEPGPAKSSSRSSWDSENELKRLAETSNSPFSVVTSHLVWAALEAAANAGFLFIPMRRIAERVAKRHPHNWESFWRAFQPYLLGRMHLDRQIIKLGQRYKFKLGQRNEEFERRVDSLIRAEAKKYRRVATKTESVMVREVSKRRLSAFKKICLWFAQIIAGEQSKISGTAFWNEVRPLMTHQGRTPDPQSQTRRLEKIWSDAQASGKKRPSDREIARRENPAWDTLSLGEKNDKLRDIAQKRRRWQRRVRLTNHKTVAS